MAEHTRRRRPQPPAGLLPSGYADSAGSGGGEGNGAERYGDEDYGGARVGYSDEDGGARVGSRDEDYDAEGYDDADGYAAEGDYYDEDGYDDEGYDDWGPEAGGYGDRRGPSAKRRRRRRHRALGVFLALVALAVLVAGGGVLWASRQVTPSGPLGRKVTVVIPKGASTTAIGSILVKAGVIHSATLFHYYVKLEGDGPFYAGTYRLATNEPYSRAVTALEKPPPLIVDKLVIPEGFTLQDIARAVVALPGMHYSAASFLALSSSGSVRSPFEPKGVNDLEGLVFPATYPVQQGESEASIMTALVAKFDAVAEQVGLSADAKKLHTTPYDVIKVASIVQGEAKYNSQMPDTASAIYNRLAKKMTLGADSTLIYALRQHNPNLNVNKVNFEQKSPYNTRLHPGLPPTPIDSPGLPALQAAAKPPSTNLLYFVEIKPDGDLGFASTSAGFARLNAECRAAHLC